MAKMQVVSSQWTLTLKLLLPTFWFCFFGGSTLVLFFTPLSNIGEPFTPMSARLIMLSFVLSTAGIYYLTFYQIKWVAMDADKLYISNFMKSFQYSYDSIARVEENRMLFWNKVTIHFHRPGYFGETIVFFASYYWHYYLKKHPDVLQQLLPADILRKLGKED